MDIKLIKSSFLWSEIFNEYRSKLGAESYRSLWGFNPVLFSIVILIIISIWYARYCAKGRQNAVQRGVGGGVRTSGIIMACEKVLGQQKSTGAPRTAIAQCTKADV